MGIAKWKIWEWDLSFRWEWDGNGNEVIEMGRELPWYEFPHIFNLHPALQFAVSSLHKATKQLPKTHFRSLTYAFISSTLRKLYKILLFLQVIGTPIMDKTNKHSCINVIKCLSLFCPFGRLDSWHRSNGIGRRKHISFLLTSNHGSRS